MSIHQTRPDGGAAAARTANDRLKASWNACVGGSIGAAAILHLAVLAYSPPFRVPEVEPAPPDVPAQMVRVAGVARTGTVQAVRDFSIPIPALPTVDGFDLDEIMQPAIEIPDFTDTSILDEALLPPLESEQGAWHDYKQFAPFVVRPVIRNRSELKRFLERNYQPILEFTGATGVVHVFFYIDEAGLVQKAEIAESSGIRALDRLAMRLSKVLRFSPAMLAGRPIRIQVRLPITFRAA